MATYKVFVRNFWKKDASGRLVPAYNARKTTIGYASTYEEARQMCTDYNEANKPGWKGRKAEFRSDY